MMFCHLPGCILKPQQIASVSVSVSVGVIASVIVSMSVTVIVSMDVSVIASISVTISVSVSVSERVSAIVVVSVIANVFVNMSLSVIVRVVVSANSSKEGACCVVRNGCLCFTEEAFHRLLLNNENLDRMVFFVTWGIDRVHRRFFLRHQR